MNIDDDLVLSLMDQGIDVASPGLPYARRAHPGLDAMTPADAYSQGFIDGLHAFAAQLPLMTEGPAHDPAEWFRRLFDPDVLPVRSG